MSKLNWLLIFLSFSPFCFSDQLGTGSSPTKTHTNPKPSRSAQVSNKDFWNRTDFEAAIISCMGATKVSVLSIIHPNDFVSVSESLNDKNKLTEIEYQDRTEKTPFYLLQFSDNKIFTFTKDEQWRRQSLKPLQDRQQAYEDFVRLLKYHFSEFNPTLESYIENQKERPPEATHKKYSSFTKEELGHIKESFCNCEKIDALKDPVKTTRENFLKNKDIYLIPEKDPKGREPITSKMLECEKSMV